MNDYAARLVQFYNMRETEWLQARNMSLWELPNADSNLLKGNSSHRCLKAKERKQRTNRQADMEKKDVSLATIPKPMEIAIQIGFFKAVFSTTKTNTICNHTGQMLRPSVV